MADLGNFTGALLVDLKLSIGKRSPILSQNAILTSTPNTVTFSYKNQPTRKLSGVVFEKSNPVSRLCFAFAEDLIGLNQDGFLGKAISDPVTGIYTIDIGTYSGNVSVVCLDGNFNSKLALAINDTTTTVTLTDIPAMNLNGMFIVIDTEIMLVTAGGNTTTLTVTRAQKLTTAASHLINATVSKISLNSRIFSKLTSDFS